jgi:predicted phage replisome organizer
MSQNQTKHYYWLKLHNDFFNRDEIKIIKGMPNGKDYLIFYLELMLKSINTKGTLMFKDTIPYTPEMLSSITQTSIDTVRVAIDAFAKLGLIEILLRPVLKCTT